MALGEPVYLDVLDSLVGVGVELGREELGAGRGEVCALEKIWNFKTGATTFLRLTDVRTVLTSGIESFDLYSANPLATT